MDKYDVEYVVTRTILKGVNQEKTQLLAQPLKICQIYGPVHRVVLVKSDSE